MIRFAYFMLLTITIQLQLECNALLNWLATSIKPTTTTTTKITTLNSPKTEFEIFENSLKSFRLLQSIINRSPRPRFIPFTTTPPVRRMSMFFFRLHNLQRAEENKRKKRVEQQRQQQRQRRGAKVFKCVSDSTGHLTLAPSRLFERTPMSPSDSLDEIALQIPRWVLPIQYTVKNK